MFEFVKDNLVKVAGRDRFEEGSWEEDAGVEEAGYAGHVDLIGGAKADAWSGREEYEDVGGRYHGDSFCCDPIQADSALEKAGGS